MYSPYEGLFFMVIMNSSTNGINDKVSTVIKIDYWNHRYLKKTCQKSVFSTKEKLQALIIILLGVS